MNVEGITWHALTLEPGECAATKAFATDVLGLEPEIDTDDWVMFRMPDGNLLDLFDPRSELFPPYGLNEMASDSVSTTSTPPPTRSPPRDTSSSATSTTSTR